jgi:hypothetical protein
MLGPVVDLQIEVLQGAGVFRDPELEVIPHEGDSLLTWIVTPALP